MTTAASTSPTRVDLDAMSDEQLACRAQAGSREAFDRLARRFHDRLRGFCLHRVRRAADADDLAQESLTRAFEQLHRYRPQWRFGTWLFCLTHRLIIDHHRRARRTQPLDHAPPLAAAQASPADALAQREARENLWRTAARVLSDDQRTALWLRYGEQMDLKQIARVMRRTTVSVKVMLLRARRKLAEHLADDLTISPHGGA